MQRGATDMHAETGDRRISAVHLCGALFVLMWAVVVAFFAGGEARADDERPAPASGLTSLVGDTLSGVATPVVKTTTSTVEKAATPVVKTVEKAATPVAKTVGKAVSKTTTAVASVPVIGEPVAATVTKTGETVAKVTETVEKVVSSAPVTAVVTPVTDVVRSVPVVGSVVDALGVPDFVDETASGVDEILDVVAPVVGGTVDPVIDGLQPNPSGAQKPERPSIEAPVIPIDAPTDTDPLSEAPAPSITEATAVDASATAAPSTSALTLGGAPMALAPEVTLTHEVAAQSPVPAHRTGSAPEPALGTAAPTSAAGSSGHSPGANSDSPAAPGLSDSISSRTGIPADAALPPSPEGSTDVSPD